MKTKSHQYLIISGLLCLLLAVVVIIVDVTTDYLAGKRAQKVLLQMQAIPSVTAGAEQPAAASLDAAVFPMPTEPDSAEPQQEAPVPATSRPAPSYNTIGVLSITALKVTLPVISECTNTALKVSICRYMGTAEGRPQRLVVAGHNYRSHFGRLNKLSAGDEICFTHPNGNKYYYAVTEILEISANDHLALREGEWDISLFTCTTDSKRRVLVRAVEVAAEEAVQHEETQPEETQPEETQPEEAQPEETQPEETQPEEAQPEETQPEETQPEEAQSPAEEQV